MIQQFHFWIFIWENENNNSRRYMYPHIHCSFVYNSQDTKATQVPINRWMDKEMQYTHTQTNKMEYYSAIKNEILPFMTAWMGLKGIKWNKRKINIILSRLYVESKK